MYEMKHVHGHTCPTHLLAQVGVYSMCCPTHPLALVGIVRCVAIIFNFQLSQKQTQLVEKWVCMTRLQPGTNFTIFYTILIHLKGLGLHSNAFYNHYAWI